MKHRLLALNIKIIGFTVHCFMKCVFVNEYRFVALSHLFVQNGSPRKPGPGHGTQNMNVSYKQHSGNKLGELGKYPMPRCAPNSIRIIFVKQLKLNTFWFSTYVIEITQVHIWGKWCMDFRNIIFVSAR